MTADFCSVANDGCKAPAGYSAGGGIYHGDKKTTGKCFACGQPACTACSRRVSWKRFGIKRICASCQSEK